MAANMKEIKRRIKSVETTMQITKAMELVASSKLRKAKERADRAKPFFDTLYETMCEIVSGTNELSSEYMKKRDVKSVALIVIAGDRGLAGGFNSNNLKLAYARAREIASEGKTVKIIAIGKKSAEFFEKREFEVLKKYIDVAESMTIYKAMSIISDLLIYYADGICDAVEIFYTSFLTTLSQEVKSLELLPFKIEKKADGKATVKTEYEPSAEAVFDRIVPEYLTGILYGAVVDSFAAEQAARRTAMESATDNAGEIIADMSLLYNRARQSSITSEIIDIIGGAQAQS